MEGGQDDLTLLRFASLELDLSIFTKNKIVHDEFIIDSKLLNYK